VARKVSTEGMSAEERAEHLFREKEQELDEQWTVVNSIKDSDPKLEAELAKIDRFTQAVFRAFDNWQHVNKHKFTVPLAEAKQLILDALQGNVDALPDTEEMTGLEKYRYCVQKADDLISALKGWGVNVRPSENGRLPLCGSCAEELAL
jgi:hypothetical protein